MQCSAIPCSAIQCNAIPCSAIQCNAILCSAIQCNAMQTSALQASQSSYYIYETRITGRLVKITNFFVYYLEPCLTFLKNMCVFKISVAPIYIQKTRRSRGRTQKQDRDEGYHPHPGGGAKSCFRYAIQLVKRFLCFKNPKERFQQIRNLLVDDQSTRGDFKIPPPPSYPTPPKTSNKKMINRQLNNYISSRVSFQLVLRIRIQSDPDFFGSSGSLYCPQTNPCKSIFLVI